MFSRNLVSRDRRLLTFNNIWKYISNVSRPTRALVVCSQQPTLSTCTLHARLQRYSCVYSALSCTHVNPPGALRVCARARLLIYFDVSLRKLRARAYSSLDPFPHPSPATTSFSGGYKSRANGGRKFAKLHFRKLCVRSTLRFIECRKWR